MNSSTITNTASKGAIRQIMVDNNLRTINFKRWNMWNQGSVPEHINSIRLDMKGGIKIYINSKGGYAKQSIIDETLWDTLYKVTVDMINRRYEYDVQERKNLLIPVGR